METFWFFRLRFRRAYDSAYDSVFRFSLGHKRSYDSDYDSDSDSVASENQPWGTTHPGKQIMESEPFTAHLCKRLLRYELNLLHSVQAQFTSKNIMINGIKRLFQVDGNYHIYVHAVINPVLNVQLWVASKRVVTVKCKGAKTCVIKGESIFSHLLI